MSKPEWNEDTPKWANWLEQDNNGAWFWYEEKPDTCAHIWINKGRMQPAKSNDAHWIETLEPRP